MRYVLLTLIISLHMNVLGQEPGCWNIFRGNQRLTGSVSANLPAKPKLLWTFATGSMIKSSPVICNERVVIGTTEGTVYCLDLKGKLLWKFKASNSIEASAMILDNTVYIGDLQGILYALDLKTGKKSGHTQPRTRS